MTPERRMRLYQFFGARGIEEERWLHLATAPEGGRPPEERVLEMGLPALDSVPVGYAQNLCPWLRRARPRLPAGVETVFGVAKSSAGVSAWLQLCGISGR